MKYGQNRKGRKALFHLTLKGNLKKKPKKPKKPISKSHKFLNISRVLAKIFNI